MEAPSLPPSPTLPKADPDSQTVTLTRLELAQLLEVLSALRVYIIGQLERCKVPLDAPTP
jgi:hypothetical protein